MGNILDKFTDNIIDILLPIAIILEIIALLGVIIFVTIHIFNL